MSKTSTQSKRKRSPAQPSARDDALLVAWEKTLWENRNRAALFDVNGEVTRTFAEIETRTARFAAEFETFSAGDVIAIQIGNHPDWPSLFLACLRKGVVALPLEQTMSEEQRRAIFETCRIVAAVVPRSKGWMLEKTGPAGRRAVSKALRSAGCQTRHAGSVRSPLVDATRWDENPFSLLKLTSGTTAVPRAIRFRSEQLLADCENICDTMGITARDVNFGVIPISHSYGFSNLLTPLLARAVPVVLSSDRMPRAILNGLAATGATVFPGMPVFYQSFCELTDAPALPKLRLCISAGAPLPLALAKRFRAKFGRAIHSFYGSSECGGICYVRQMDATPGFVGPPMRGVEIDALEESGAFRVRSRAVGDGYFPEPDEAKLGNGIFTPDDLLQKTPDGYRIVGRVSDLINVAGKKVGPAEVEAQIMRFAGVREAVVFGRESERRNQEVVACVVATGGVSEEQLLAHCRARLSSWQTPRRIFFVDRIPVNERGKISRRELARRYAAGGEAAVPRVPHD